MLLEAGLPAVQVMCARSVPFGVWMQHAAPVKCAVPQLPNGQLLLLVLPPSMLAGFGEGQDMFEEQEVQLYPLLHMQQTYPTQRLPTQTVCAC